jgi:hypothetical protein
LHVKVKRTQSGRKLGKPCATDLAACMIAEEHAGKIRLVLLSCNATLQKGIQTLCIEWRGSVDGLRFNYITGAHVVHMAVLLVPVRYVNPFVTSGT